MGYNSAAVRSRGGYMVGYHSRGSLGSFLRGVGRIAGTVARVATNPIGALTGAVASLAPQAAQAQTVLRGPSVSLGGPAGFNLQGPSLSLGGGGGGAAGTVTGAWPKNKNGTPRRARKDGKPYKRPTMNPLNPRAAFRSIRRVKSARHILHRIESMLPKARGSYRGSPGVITRSEAARALRR